jgi:site-specific recombinase XerD
VSKRRSDGIFSFLEIAPTINAASHHQNRFRHTHATLLAEVGESVKTAQALLGHSDLETTLNTYAHALPASQRRVVERVSEVLFSNVLELRGKQESGKPN